MITFNEYLAYLKTNERVPVYKFDLLKPDETTYKTIEDDIANDSGGFSISAGNGVRRSCNFDIFNINRAYSDFFKDLPLGSKFRLWAGFVIRGENYFPSPVGTFIFDNPVISSQSEEKLIKVSGTDKWATINGKASGIFEKTYTIARETTVKDFFSRTLNLSIVSDPVAPILDSSLANEKITYDITKTKGETVADMFLDVAANINADIFYDEYGRLNVIPYQEDLYKNSIYDLGLGEYNYLGGDKEYKLNEIYNAVALEADNPQNNKAPIYCEVLNNDPTDPNSIINCGVKKTKIIKEYLQGIDTYDKALERCNYELKKAKNKIYSLPINLLYIPHLNVNEVITLTDGNLNANRERQVITELDFSIGTDCEGTATLRPCLNW